MAAAPKSASGAIYTGICVDGACTLGICAERNALFSLLIHGRTPSAGWKRRTGAAGCPLYPQ